MTNQQNAIMQYIGEFGSITPVEAFADLGITKLATRISELKRQGYKFVTTRITKKTRYGTKTTFCRYSLAKGGKSERQK